MITEVKCVFRVELTPEQMANLMAAAMGDISKSRAAMEQPCANREFWLRRIADTQAVLDVLIDTSATVITERREEVARV